MHKRILRKGLVLGIIVIFVGIIIFSVFTMETNVFGTTVNLEDIDSGHTSPTGDYRWLDMANQSYSSSYRNSYNYTQASVTLTYDEIGESFHGTLIATNLKPNFAYQVKLSGISGTPSNELIGLAGRWWQEEWNGTAWSNGQNLNNKGNGSSPNPNDILYYARKNITNVTSPTGLKYCYTGYLVFDYFLTDEYGNATLNFEANSSYHVLWKTSQRTRTVDDGPLKSSTFDANISLPAYDTNYPLQTVDLFGEWERLPVGGIFLQSRGYSAQFMLTEESFHGDGGTFSGNWAAAMGQMMLFTIPDVYVDDDADPSWYDATHVRTIQEGVINATEEDTIFVYNGIYEEQIQVDKSVILEGESNITTVVDGGFNITADNTTINSFNITNGIENDIDGAGGVGADKIGIYVSSSNNTIINNDILMIVGGSGENGVDNKRGGNSNAIYLNFSNGNIIKHNIISSVTGGPGGGNSDVHDGGNGGTATAIFLNSSSYNNITLNIFFNLIGGGGGSAYEGNSPGKGGDAVGVYLESSSINNNISLNTIKDITGGTGGGSSHDAGDGGDGLGFYLLSSSHKNNIISNNVSNIKGGNNGYAQDYNGASGDGLGIYLHTTNDTLITSNNFSNISGGTYFPNGWGGGHSGSSKGMFLELSTNTSIYNNTIMNILSGIMEGEQYSRDNVFGIDLLSSSRNYISTNKLSYIIGESEGYFSCSATGINLNFISNYNSISLNDLTNISGGDAGGIGGHGTGINIDSSNGNNISFTNISNVTAGKSDDGNGGHGTGINIDSSNGNNISFTNISNVIGGISSGYGGGNGGSGTGINIDSSNGNNISFTNISNVIGGTNDNPSGNNGTGTGIHCSQSSNNTIISCKIFDNEYSISLTSSNDNLFYNNFFNNNTYNALDNGNNIWNITKTLGTNIIGGPYLGGNFWSDYYGVDLDGDLIGDTNLPYNCSGNIQNGGDWLPLTQAIGSLAVHNLDTGENFSTIQEAIDDPDTLPGHTIYVENGTYYENVIIDKSISLLGENRYNTIINGGGSGDVVYVTVDRVNISGFIVQNGGNGTDDAGIKVYSSNNSVITNCSFYDNERYGIYLRDSSNNTITNCDVYNNSATGIRLYSWPYYSSNNTITNCNVYNNMGSGILSSGLSNNLVIKNCDVYINLGKGIDLFFVSNNTITNCNVYNNTLYGIRLYLSSNNTITDCDVYNNPASGILIDNNSPNTTITNCNFYNNTGGGFYIRNSPNNTITNCSAHNNKLGGISSISNSPNTTITNCSFYNNERAGITCSSNDNVIINCDVYNNTGDFVDGIKLYGSFNTITDCSVYNNERYGIYLRDSSNNTITNCTVYDNSDDGIYLHDSCNNNVIINCDVYNNTNNGICLYHWQGIVSNNTIANCFVYNNTNDGIVLSFGSTNNTIKNCFVYNNSDDGIICSSNNTIANCFVYNNSDDGIYLYHSSNNNVIENCDVYNNERYGIYLYSSSNNTITNCSVNNNTDDGFYFYDYCDNNKIISNKITNNRRGMLFRYSSDNIILYNSIGSNNVDGIELHLHSDSNVIQDNNFIMNDIGIHVSDDSITNTISKNNISNNRGGIHFYSADSNVIFNNDLIANYDWSVRLTTSDNNMLYHNNFINTGTFDAQDFSSNIWDDSYPSGGNYWDEYTGSDLDGDGIGDIAYNIYGGSNQDLYPLMQPYNPWSVTLNFASPESRSDHVVFGERPGAKDGQDSWDVPKPGCPPRPYIYAWFDANLTIPPYEKLWKDYRLYPDENKTWDLYMLCNTSGPVLDSTNITISWKTDDVNQSEYAFVKLFEYGNSIPVADMRTVTKYTFNATFNALYHFQIVCKSSPFVVSLSEKWNIISAPCYESIDKTEIIIVNNSIEYSWSEAMSEGIILGFLYDYNRTSHSYDISESLEPGNGYWVWAYHNCELLIFSNSVGNGHITNLEDGWSLMGSPYNTTIPKTSINITYDNTNYTWDEAVSNEIILGFVYGWNTTDQLYELRDDFASGRGYWMYAYQPCTLLRPVT